MEVELAEKKTATDKDRSGVPNGEIQLFMSCFRGIARAVLKDMALRENPRANALAVSIRLEKSLREKDMFQKFVFYSEGGWVYVLGCLSESHMPDREDDFIFCASHDSGWFDDGTDRLRELLRDGPYKKIIDFEVKILYIREKDFRFRGDLKARHRVDIFRKHPAVTLKESTE